MCEVLFLRTMIRHTKLLSYYFNTSFNTVKTGEREREREEYEGNFV